MRDSSHDVEQELGLSAHREARADYPPPPDRYWDLETGALNRRPGGFGAIQELHSRGVKNDYLCNGAAA